MPVPTRIMNHFWIGNPNQSLHLWLLLGGKTEYMILVGDKATCRGGVDPMDTRHVGYIFPESNGYPSKNYIFQAYGIQGRTVSFTEGYLKSQP